jgi:hypothetical protein
MTSKVKKSDQEAKEAKIQKYIESLTPIEKKTYLIAKDHLGSSFDIEHSIGFMDFVRY